jgi:1,4-dihydroxy-2-naphthoate polyprenyltransferase
MLQRSTLQLLRFPFSLFLLPVYLFALSQVREINWYYAIAVFGILHLLVYPASNGYNSFMDRDESPVGGIKKPMQPTRQLFVFTVVMDLLATVFAFLLNFYFAIGVIVYIIASRAYSYRGIRLKQYPVIGFLTVFVMQGAIIFYITYLSTNAGGSLKVPWLPCFISSLLIGALYPLTQVYQHEDDRKDNVTTLSYLLGKKGSFIFSMLLFLLATTLLYFLFSSDNILYFFLFIVMLSPVAGFFMYWMLQVWKDDDAANFRNSFLMNIISTCCTTIFFITLIILKH